MDRRSSTPFRPRRLLVLLVFAFLYLFFLAGSIQSIEHAKAPLHLKTATEAAALGAAPFADDALSAVPIAFESTLLGDTLRVSAKWDSTQTHLTCWSFSWDRSGTWETTRCFPFRKSNLFYAEQIAQFVRDSLWDSTTARFIGIKNEDGTIAQLPSHPTWDAMEIMGHVWLFDRTQDQKYLNWAKDYANILIEEWDSQYGGWPDYYIATNNKAAWNMSFPMYALGLLYDRTNDAAYLDLAVQAGDLLATEYFDCLYGGYFYSCNRDYSLITTKKHSEFLGSIAQAFMLLWDLTGEPSYLDYAASANDFIVSHFYTGPHVGIPAEMNRDGTSQNWYHTAPNTNHWGTLGLTDYQHFIYNEEYTTVARDIIDYVHECFWDSVYGGNMRYVAAPGCNIATNSKITHMNIEHGWMYYKDYLLLGDEKYRDWAGEVIDFCIDHLYDYASGGMYEELKYDLSLSSKRKVNLHQAGAIMALSYSNFYRDPEWSIIDRILGPADVGKTIHFYISAFDDQGNEFQTAIDSVEFVGSGATGVRERSLVSSHKLLLDNCYPNPFNPRTTISFTLPERLHASLAIFDIEGRRIKTLVDEVYDKGRKEIVWDGTDESGTPVASGIYFYRLEAGGMTVSRKMAIIK